MKIAIIAARARNHVIGNGPDIPWQVKGEQRLFRDITMGGTLIMGRKTFESIGRPLPGRMNIVVTRNAAWHAEGVVVVQSLEDALLQAERHCRVSGESELFVIGGEQIYRLAIDRAEKVYLTRVYAEVDGDAFFPELAVTDWELTQRTPGDGGAGYGYDFLVYERR